MKNAISLLTCIVIALLALSFTTSAQAQNQADSSAARIDTVNIKMGKTTILVITDEAGEDTLNIIDGSEPEINHAEDYEWSGVSGFQFGFLGLVNTDGSRALSDRPDLSMNTEQCSMIGVTPFEVKGEIIKDRMRIAAGLGMQFESYAFAKNIRLTDEPSLQGIEDSTRTYRKNTLNANYVTLPVMLQFNTKRNLDKAFHFGFGAVAGYRVGANMTYKWSEDGHRQRERRKDDYALEPYRISAIAQIGIGNSIIWAQYDLTMKFTATDYAIMVVGLKGTPEVYAWSAGISIPF